MQIVNSESGKMNEKSVPKRWNF